MIPNVSQPSAAAPAMPANWLAHTWQLTRWNLRLARRRLMSKILAGILLLLFLVVIFFLLLTLVAERSYTQSATICPSPNSTAVSSASGQPTSSPCVPDSSADQSQPTSSLDQQLAQTITFPDIWAVAGGYTTFMGAILLCILAGALIGSEYGYGTQRLALSRGVSRAQLISAQVAALAIMALIVSGAMLLVGTLFGVTVGPLVGGSIPGISLAGWGQLLLFWLVVALHLLAYTLIALLLGTLGRSTAVGIAGALGYLIFEAIAESVLIALSVLPGNPGATANAAYHVLLGPNLGALLNGVSQSPLDLGGSSSSSGLGPDPIPTGQGLLVVAIYCLLLISLSYWLVRKRDVTN